MESSRLSKKTYAAVLLGCPEGSHRARRLCVDAALGRDALDPRRIAVKPDGQAASSIVNVHRHSERYGATLVTVELLTGRMHQIRVHCAHLGAPVVGDVVYGNRQKDAAFQAALRSSLPTRRPLLHAWALELPHPRQGKEPLSLRAPLPKDMRGVIAQLWPDLPADPSLWPGEESTTLKKKKKSTPGKSEEELPGTKPKDKASKAVAPPNKKRGTQPEETVSNVLPSSGKKPRKKKLKMAG